MKTRKRTLSAANSSPVPANLTQETTIASQSPCSLKHLFLQQYGYVPAPISHNIAGTFAIAVKAFQAQLEVLNKQQPQNRHAGYKQLGGKQRLEFRAGDSALGQLGMLQEVATTVRDLSWFFAHLCQVLYHCLNHALVMLVMLVMVALVISSGGASL